MSSASVSELTCPLSGFPFLVLNPGNANSCACGTVCFFAGAENREPWTSAGVAALSKGLWLAREWLAEGARPAQ